MIRIVERVPNRFGIMVKKCCASCQHKCLDDLARRKCELTKRPVRANYSCDNWQMSEQLDMIGCERGKVQRREYQLSLMEVRTSELNAMAKGKEMEPASVESIRRDFELKHGSRFALH